MKEGGVNLEEKIDRAIESQKFYGFETIGFGHDYKLALKAGAIIGYRIGLQEQAEANERLKTVLRDAK